MASHRELTEMKLLQKDNSTVDSALSAFEEGMFKNHGQHEKEHIANDMSCDSLRYLFSIFN